MPTILGIPPILDSSGAPANGLIYVTASREFDTDAGLVTQARSIVRVSAGAPSFNGEAWTIPATPPGVFFTIEQDLDGEQVRTRTNVVVPDVPNMTFSQLLFNRGTGAGGAGPYMWDLTGGADFGDAALNGDWGIDTTPVSNKIRIYQKVTN